LRLCKAAQLGWPDSSTSAFSSASSRYFLWYF
jgi:hypothetical protein